MFLTSIIFLRIVSFFSLPTGDISSIKMTLRLLADLLAFLYLFTSLKFKKNTPIKFSIRKSILFILYILFLGLATLSLLYSTSYEKSLIQLIMYLESFAFSFVLALIIYEISLRKFINSLVTSIDITSVLFIFLSIYLPLIAFRFTPSDQTYRLGGFIINPNELGLLFTIGILIHIIFMTTARRIFTFIYHSTLISLLTYALYLTHSRSSFIGLLTALIILVFFTRRKVLYLTLISIIFLFSMPIIINEIFFRGGKKEEFITMTGRIPFWKDLISDAFPEKFLTGFGFQRIYYSDVYTSIHSYSGEMAHNTFIQSFLGLGICGGIITLMLTLLTFINIITEREKEIKKLLLTLYIPIVVNSFTEFGIFGFYNFDVLIFQLLILYLMIGERKQYENRNGVY